MGTDPRRRDGLLPDEAVAALLVEGATGARATAHDVDGRQGAYDVALSYPDGRRAALEVTTNARPRHPARWGPPAQVPHGVAQPRSARLEHRTGRTARHPSATGRLRPRCAVSQTQSASALVAAPGGDPDGAVRPAPITVTLRPPGGSVDGRLESLPDAVSHLLLVPHVSRRVAKVAAATGVDERHLFVGIGEGGLPDAVYRGLSTPVESLPREGPEIEEPRLSHVWLTTDWGGSPLLCWDRTRGWSQAPRGDLAARRISGCS